jgi:transposase-like protein
MTYQSDCKLPEELLEQIAADGLEALPGLIRTLVNEAMRLEREQHLTAGAYERTPTRRGYANGYRPKTVKTRLGEIERGHKLMRQSELQTVKIGTARRVRPKDLKTFIEENSSTPVTKEILE